ncbi:MAG: DUF4234 domain-containing protein [bacterium]
MKNRSPITVFLLSIITLGIYDIYWLVVTKNELTKRTKQHVPTIWLLIFPLIPFIAGYILLIASGMYSQPSTCNSLSGYQGVSYQCTQADMIANNPNIHTGPLIVGAILILVFGATFFITSLIWFFKFSKAINEFTKGKMSTAVTFLILWLIHLIGVALIQDAINDRIGSKK